MFVNIFYLAVLLICISQIAGQQSIFITDKHLVLGLFVRRVLGMSPLTLQNNNGQFSFLQENVSYSQCIKGTDKLRSKIGFGIMGETTINNMMFFSCDTLKIQPIYVCRGIADNYSKILTHILRNTRARSSTICEQLLGTTIGSLFGFSGNQWEIQLSQKPVVPPDLNNIKNLTILHIADIHADKDYSAGNLADCIEALCCRDSSSGITPRGAGYWGEYKCGTPLHFLSDTFNQIKTNLINIDYIILTGNILPPDPWVKKSNMETIDDVANSLKNAFPNTPIYATIGNYDSIPSDNFPFPGCVGVPQDYDWNIMYRSHVQIWRDIFNIRVNETELINHGAYYNVEHIKGLRIISINSMFCYTSNWWLMLYDKDPTSELEWLEKQLQNAESKGDKVHIIGHIPPGSKECLDIWSYNYNMIITRYENTVAAQFFGHTHFKEIQVMYDLQNSKRPVNVVYVGSSLSTYKNLNPAYTIYTTNEHGMVLKGETWSTDINKANENGTRSPVWTMVSSPYYDYDTLGLGSYKPIDWNNFINIMAENRSVFDIYYNDYWHNTANKPTCDETCRNWILCGARSSLHYKWMCNL